MKIIEPSATLLWITPDAEKLIERAGRVCYKSECKITDDTAGPFIRRIIESHHESVIEHAVASFMFVCDRGVSHELVRHRIASFSQESTRYVRSVTRERFQVISPEDVVRVYLSGETIERVAELSAGKYTNWEVWKILRDGGIKRRGHNRRGIIRHDFFDSIDSPEKAYLLGFIQADGNLHRNGSQISISQKASVAWFINRMVRDFIYSEAKAYPDKNSRTVQWSSEQMHASLVRKGIVPNKSYYAGDEEADALWRSIPDDLIPDFLRGFMEGDGSVRFFQQKNPGKTDSCFLIWLGTHALLERIKSWLQEKHGYAAKVSPVHGTAQLYRIAVTKPKIAEDVCRSMYRNFRFPYGHPEKVSRIWERLKFEYSNANWGDEKFMVVNPFGRILRPEVWMWAGAVDASEDAYADMTRLGCAPQIARSVLPTCLKTEIVTTANLREWRHIIRLRTSSAAHPQIREVVAQAASVLRSLCPNVFHDIE